MLNLVSLLVQAQTLITPRDSWTKGRMVRLNSVGKRSYCAVGALYAASTRTQENNRLCDEAWKLLNEVAGDSISTVNDRPQTTHEEILTYYDLAILRAHEKERAQEQTP